MRLEGLQFDQYHLLKLLKMGGMGEVYLAEDVKLKRRVVLKVIRTDRVIYADDDEAREAMRLFLREVQFVATLDHPNILPLYDAGEKYVDGITLMYMVMPLCEEGSLTDWLKRHYAGGTGTLSPHIVERIVRQAASALQYAHEHNIIHQDVKPSNFLIRDIVQQPGQLYLQLTDFGVAKLATTTSHSQIIRGTPTHMAPEQWEGQAVPGSDQYALAVMAYELLTGQPPFEGGNHQQMWYQHSYVEPPPPSSLNPQLPDSLDSVLLRALAKTPRERYNSISAFALAFRQALVINPTPQVDQTSPDINKHEPEEGIKDFPARRNSPFHHQILLFNMLSTFISIPIYIFTNLIQQSLLYIHKWFESPNLSPTTMLSKSPQHSSNVSTILFTESQLPQKSLKDFFICYNRADTKWASWIAHTLEEAGYTTIMPEWDFHLGTDFEKEMQKALVKTKCIILVLSPDYLKSDKKLIKLIRKFTQNAVNDQITLLPICVHNCETDIKNLLGSIVYLELMQLDELAALEKLLAAVQGKRIKSSNQTKFPGNEVTENLKSVDEAKIMTESVSNIQRIKESNVFLNDANPNLMQIIDVSFANEDWNNVIRKIEFLIKQTSYFVSYRIYQMLGQAYRAQGNMLSARQAFSNALALVIEQHQRLLLLEEYIVILTFLQRWKEMLDCINEALQIAPNEPKWLALQQQALLELQQTKNPANSNKIVSDSESILGRSFLEVEEQLGNLERETIILPLSSLLRSHPDTSIKITFTGGTQMSIEQEALQVADFLRTFRKQIIEHPEFGKVYGDAGRIDQQVEQLAAALATNFQLLQEARESNDLHPGNILTHNAIQMHLQGLSHTILKVESLWHQIRSGTLAKTESLIIKVEQETSKQVEQEDSDEEAQQDITEVEKQEPSKRNWFKSVLTGLNLFKDFLIESNDIKQAMIKLSPALVNDFRNTLDQLGHFIGQIKF